MLLKNLASLENTFLSLVLFPRAFALSCKVVISKEESFREKIDASRVLIISVCATTCREYSFIWQQTCMYMYIYVYVLRRATSSAEFLPLAEFARANGYSETRVITWPRALLCTTNQPPPTRRANFPTPNLLLCSNSDL